MSNAQFFIVTGTNNEAQMYSRSGSYIFTICTMSTWIWQVDVEEDGVVALGTDDGGIFTYKINEFPVECCFRETYAIR